MLELDETELPVQLHIIEVNQNDKEEFTKKMLWIAKKLKELGF